MRFISLFTIFSFLLFSCNNSIKTTEPYSGPVNLFGLDHVELLESPFQQAMITDKDYILELDPDRFLAPFRKQAGLEPNAKGYPNWEATGLSGHVGGHYLTALAQMYAATGDIEMKKRLDYMIDELAFIQETHGNGYVGGVEDGNRIWAEIRDGNIRALPFNLNGGWVPLYNIHKTYAGLRDAFLVGGNEKAKTVLVKLTDWMIDLTSELSDEQMQEMLKSEPGGLNEVFADVAAITGEAKYITLAKRFSHRFMLDAMMNQQDVLTGMHGNTQMPKVIGFKRISDIDENTDWTPAVNYFWDNVVDYRTVSIGGNSVREHFNPVDNYSSMMQTVQGPETCNTYNMLRLTEMMYATAPTAKQVEYYERALYNHILSTQHPDGGFVYFTPMRPRHYRVYSQPETSFWCCIGSGIENHGKYGRMIYAKAENELFVNLFIPSVVSWEEQGIKITQETRFPEADQSTITFSMDSPSAFGVNLRYPSWAQDMTVALNGKKIKVNAEPGEFFRIEHNWQDGDQLTLSIPKKIYVEQLPDGSDWYSILYGPLVMSQVTSHEELHGLWADDARMAHIADGPRYPADQAPKLIVSHPDEITANIEVTPEGELLYKGKVHPESYSEFTLTPFYNVHEARYMLYWQAMDQEKLDDRLAGMISQEEEMRRLDALTIDQVAPGEQQPEVEHDFRGENTNSGTNDDRLWRDATGWFSYVLKSGDKSEKVLRLTYFNGDAGRKFRILINGKVLENVEIPENDEAFFDVDYQVPISYLAETGQITLRFEAEEGSTAGGIYDIRLMEPAAE